MAVGLLLRLYFLILVGTSPPDAIVDNHHNPFVLGLQTLSLGLLNDCLAASLLSAGWFAAKLVHRQALVITATVLTLVVFVVTVAEVFFWHEFSGRLDRLVFHYLAYPEEVAIFLHEQFFIGLVLIPLGFLVWLVLRFWRQHLATSNVWNNTLAPARPKALVILFLSISIWFVAKPVSVSHDRLLNHLASNGYLEVLAAAKVDATQWIGHYWSPSTSDEAPALLLQQHSSPAQFTSRAPQHVVLIIEESFSGATWSDPELRQRYLPHTSRLITQSRYFDNAYATGSRTTRGQEALLAGYPPLPGVATTQRPQHDKLPSLPRALASAGFYNIFVYAGWPTFSDFTQYWQAAGFAQITDRTDFDPAGFETSWGYADEYSFNRLLNEMDRLTQEHLHVFAATLTLSHHRPFDYPDGRIDFPADERRSEYAMAYADWALGKFIEEARTKPWFKDTLFVIAADHGARFYGSAPIPVNSYRVPLLLFAPELLNAETDSSLASIMDVPLTVLDALGLDNTERFYGRSLLRPVPEGTQLAVPVEHAYAVGLLSERQLTVLHHGGARSAWTLPAALNQAQSGSIDGYRASAVDEQQAAQAARLFGNAHARVYAEKFKR